MDIILFFNIHKGRNLWVSNMCLSIKCIYLIQNIILNNYMIVAYYILHIALRYTIITFLMQNFLSNVNFFILLCSKK